MSALILDAGAFLAVERGDRSVVARLRIAQQNRIELRTSAIVVGQVWRNSNGQQANPARLLKAVEVRPVDEAMGREAGLLLARSGTNDPIDATVVLVADRGDRIMTSDPGDILHLAESAGKGIAVITC